MVLSEVEEMMREIENVSVSLVDVKKNKSTVKDEILLGKKKEVDVLNKKYKEKILKATGRLEKEEKDLNTRAIKLEENKNIIIGKLFLKKTNSALSYEEEQMMKKLTFVRRNEQ